MVGKEEENFFLFFNSAFSCLCHMFSNRLGDFPLRLKPQEDNSLGEEGRGLVTKEEGGLCMYPPSFVFATVFCVCHCLLCLPLSFVFECYSYNMGDGYERGGGGREGDVCIHRPTPTEWFGAPRR